MIARIEKGRKRRSAVAAAIALIILGGALPPMTAEAQDSPKEGAADVAPAPEKPSDGQYIGTETLEACMARWDEGTHMTRDAWRQSCERIRGERAPYVKGR